MPATLVTAAQRHGFARQRDDAVGLAALLVCEDDGDMDTAFLCLLIAARVDAVLRGPSRSWQKYISRSSGEWKFDNFFGDGLSQYLLKLTADEVKGLAPLLQLPMDRHSEVVVNRNRFSQVEAVTVLLARLAMRGTWHQLSMLLGGRAPSAYSLLFVHLSSVTCTARLAIA